MLRILLSVSVVLSAHTFVPSSASLAIANGISCGVQRGSSSGNSQCTAPMFAASPTRTPVVAEASPSASSPQPSASLPADGGGRDHAASSCTAPSLSVARYRIPTLGKAADSFRQAVLDPNQMPYNDSIRQLLRDWYYHDNLTSGDVAAAAASYARTPVIIGSVLFFLAVAIPILGALCHCCRQRRSKANCTRSPWSDVAVVGMVALCALAAVTVTFSVLAMLGSFRSRDALQKVQPLVTGNLNQLDSFVASTILDMNATLVGRGGCLANYVDERRRVLPRRVQELRNSEERLRTNLSQLAADANVTRSRLLDLQLDLARLSEHLQTLSDPATPGVRELLANLSMVCEDTGDMVGNESSPLATSMPMVCGAYADWMNISTHRAGIEEHMSVVVGLVDEARRCVDESVGSDWMAMLQTLNTSRWQALHMQLLDNTSRPGSLSGEEWLRSVVRSMEQAHFESQQFLNDTLGLPKTYSEIQNVMDRHVELYEAYRLVLSLILLILTLLCVLCIVILSASACVLARCKGCGSAGVSRSERLTFLGRTIQRLVTGGYFCFTVLLLTAGWFLIGASLLGAPCGTNRSMMAAVENAIDNPYIWDGQLPLARQVLRNSSSQYPLTVSGLLRECRAWDDAGDRKQTSTLWRALRLDERQPLAQLSGQDADFGLNLAAVPVLNDQILHKLKQYRHTCLNLKSRQRLWADIDQLVGHIQELAVQQNLILDQLSSTNSTASTGGVVAGGVSSGVAGGIGPQVPTVTPTGSASDLQAIATSTRSTLVVLNTTWSSHKHRQAAHHLVNQTAAVISEQKSELQKQSDIQLFASCTSDLMLTQTGQCGVLPCLYQSTAHSMCGDYLSGVDTFWFFVFWTAVALCLTLIVASWLSWTYFIEELLVLHDFSLPKAIAGQLLASTLFGLAWILDLMVTVEFFRERSDVNKTSQSMWMAAVVLLILSGLAGSFVRAVCWVLVDKASGATDLSEQRNWIHRRHGWQFFGDLTKLCVQDIPFFALLVVYCHDQHYVGTVSLSAMILALVGICYFFVFVLVVNFGNTRRYFSWLINGSHDKRGKYTVHSRQTSPVSEELKALNGVKLKPVSANRHSASDLRTRKPSREERCESESDAETLDRTQDLEAQDLDVQETEVGTFAGMPGPLEQPSWTRKPEALAVNLEAPEVQSADGQSEASAAERRHLRSTTRVQPAKVAPAPAVATGHGGSVSSDAGVSTRSATAGHYTSGPRSDLAVTCSNSSLASAGNGRPASTALALDQMLNGWDDKSVPGGSTRKKYATWSQAPPAHLMAALERQMTQQRGDLEGTSTFCTLPDPIVEEDPAPPEERNKTSVLDSDVSYAARTASLPTSERARKRYQRRLVTGTAGPDAERIRQRSSVYSAVTSEEQLQDIEYHVTRSSTLSVDV